MNVGETLKCIVEQRKDDYLEAKEVCISREQVEHYEKLFISAVNAYATWLIA